MIPKAGFRTQFLCSLLLVGLACAPTYSQTKKNFADTKSKQAEQVEIDRIAADLAAANDDVITAAKNYKASLERLLPFQEQDVETANRILKERKKLVEQQIVSHREVEDSERIVAASEARVNETRRLMREADQMIAEHQNFDPKAEAKRIMTARKIRERTPQGRIYYVRFVIVGEIAIYDYSGAVSGQVIKYRQQVKHDSRRYR